MTDTFFGDEGLTVMIDHIFPLNMLKKKSFTIQSNSYTEKTLNLSIQNTCTQHKPGHTIPFSEWR